MFKINTLFQSVKEITSNGISSNGTSFEENNFESFESNNFDQLERMCLLKPNLVLKQVLAH